MYTRKNLSKKIRNVREEKKWTREQLAKKAGVNYNTIIKLESGANDNPTAKTLISLSKVLGVGIEWLLR